MAKIYCGCNKKFKDLVLGWTKAKMFAIIEKYLKTGEPYRSRFYVFKTNNY